MTCLPWGRLKLQMREWDFRMWGKLVPPGITDQCLCRRKACLCPVSQPVGWWAEWVYRPFPGMLLPTSSDFSD